MTDGPFRQMEPHRGHLGAALLGLTGACWIGAVLAVAGKSIRWTSPYAIGLLVAGLACLVGAIAAFEMLSTALRPIAAMVSRLRHLPPIVADSMPLVLRNPVLWRGLRSARAAGDIAAALRIRDARWGIGGRQADVTDKVRRLVSAGESFIADNDTLMGGGDPAEFEIKSLVIRGRFARARDDLVWCFTEGDRVGIATLVATASLVAGPTRA